MEPSFTAGLLLGVIITLAAVKSTAKALRRPPLRKPPNELRKRKNGDKGDD